MKKGYLFLLLIITFTAKSQCVIDTTHFGAGKYVFPDTLPCAVIGSMYDTSVQVYLPRTIFVDEVLPGYPHIQARVDSIQIDSITGLPDSLMWNMNPSSKKIYGGNYGCFGVYGKVVGDTGIYNVGIWGTTWFNVLLLNKDTFQKGDFSAVFPVRINVIQPGTPCYNEQLPNAIEAITSVSKIAVFPNPFTTEITVETANEKIEKIQVFDKLGRQILMYENINQSSFVLKTSNLLSSGIYFLRVSTNTSTYNRSISYQQ
jgi:hypothetical protein